jgi:hypothetical protein
MRASISVCVCVAISFCYGSALAQENVDDCRELDQALYTDVAELARSLPTGDPLRNVQISAADIADREAVARLDPHRSPQGTAFFVQVPPDTTQPGPWDTRIHVYGNEARPLDLKVDFLEHASYEARADWINEELLFLQAWLGRIVAIDLILAVEEEAFVYTQAADYGRLLLPCEEKRPIR